MAFGDEKNTGKVNKPGIYKDEESGAVLTVTMESGADALVRLGWKFIGDLPENEADRIAIVPGDVKAEPVASEVKEASKSTK